MYDTIEYFRDEGVGIIKLNRPERMNAVIEEMYREIDEVLDLTRFDPKIHVLIITGSTLKREGIEREAFCAGADLKKHSRGDRSHAQKRDYILLGHETTRKIYEFPKPIIAAINGPARGAGSELALNCDLILMAMEATIAFPETGLGTFVGGGVTCHLPKIVGLMKAKELIYSGRVIDGKTAVDMGLALRCFPAAKLLKETILFAGQLCEKAPISMGFAKKRLQQSFALDMETVLSLEAEAILSCMDTDDWQEGVRSFNEKRKPIYKGK